MGWPSFFVGPSTLALGLSHHLQHPRLWWAFPSWRGLSCWACCAHLGIPACGWLFLAVLGTSHRYGRWDGFRHRGVSHPWHSACRAVVVVVVLSSLLSFRGRHCPFTIVVVLSRLSLCCRGHRCAVAVVVVLSSALLLRCCHVASVVMVGYAGIGEAWGQWGGIEWKTENEPRLLSWLVFLTHCVGLPLSGSPLEFFLPLSVRRGKKSRPTSLWRGEGHGLHGQGALLVVGGRMNQDQPLMRLILN
jgi:hypothetical protein